MNQPMPKRGFGNVQDELVKLIRIRQAAGAAEYGVPQLEAGNGRDALMDALEEAVDLSVYLMQCVMERYRLRLGRRTADTITDDELDALYDEVAQLRAYRGWDS